MSAGADPVRQLDSRESRTAAEIEQTAARTKTGAVPEIVRLPRPQAMLRLQAPALLGVGTEEVGLLRGGSGVLQWVRSAAAVSGGAWAEESGVEGL